ncbi:NK-tumor recognition protein isoform X2 [Macrotis lagotis]|uniref:NK-tumor recognition protein isoform X2 n=1 Tax=Macrotis lagotis TaxID=92651 RepID=UPI003D684950
MPVVTVEPEPKLPDIAPILNDQKPSVSKSGRKIKGRGTIRYHTPPRSRSCSESDDDESSETPPHWKEEMQRLRAYRPPSGEKWSKGDKLSDPCSSRWDERSLSQRSRSWSYNGYYSDLSTVRHSDSHHKKHRKEKKVKHKKKAKKQKHCKRHKPTKKKKISQLSNVGSSRSSVRQMKSPCARERRSHSSSSSQHSSKRGWSKSDKDEQSSSTQYSRDSHSYYRSKSQSRSYSKGSSRSRTASKSSSLSRSRSKSRSNSKSRCQRTTSKSPRSTASRLNENKPIKTEPLRATVPPNDKVVVQPIVAENIPVIPLSDSPPPSRWKPGQKPWKPSYERIQEMKAKTTHLLPPPNTYNLINIKEPSISSSYRKREKSSDSDWSGYSKYRSDRSSESSPRSRSRSSRSRSYSRSYSRSRSLASSHSRSQSLSTPRSHSRGKYSDRSRYSRSSSYSVSSDDGRRTRRKSRANEKSINVSKKRQVCSSERTLSNKYAKGGDESSRKRKDSESKSSLDYSSDSEQSFVKVTQPNLDRDKHDQGEGTNNMKQEKNVSSNRDEEKLKSEWDSDHSKRKMLNECFSDHLLNGEKSKRKNYAGSRWDSESNSEREVNKNKVDFRPVSDKEEGEATSESDTEFVETFTKTKPTPKSSENILPDESAWKPSRQHLSSSISESSHSNSENHRGKSKKHKHRSEKNVKKEHTKKVKEKSKGKKEKKHKVQKRKEIFHWQPPLEFGEEEEEEINENQLTKDTKGKKHDFENNEITKDKSMKTEKLCGDNSHSSKQNVINTSADSNPLSKDDIKPNASTSILNADKNVSVSQKNNQHIDETIQSGTEDVVQTDDNMEICTPERNSPVKLEISPPSNLSFDTPDRNIALNQDLQNENLEAVIINQESNVTENKKVVEVGKQESNILGFASTFENAVKSDVSERSQSNIVDNKWKPLQGVGNLSATTTSSNMEIKTLPSVPDTKPQGLRIEIKSKNKVRPGSLFDEVRKTARLNRRPRNQESSSDEQTPSRDDNSQSRSPSRSRSKSETKSRHRTRSVSYSHSRSRSRSSTYSYRSRSYSRSRSRGWYSRDRSRSRSSSYHSYKSHRTYSRSRSRSSSYDHHSRSRSYTYDSYYSSRSRSRSKRSDSYRRSRSYNRRSRSCRSYGSDSESDRSYSNHRSPSESSRYS